MEYNDAASIRPNSAAAYRSIIYISWYSFAERTRQRAKRAIAHSPSPSCGNKVCDIATLLVAKSRKVVREIALARRVVDLPIDGGASHPPNRNHMQSPS